MKPAHELDCRNCQMYKSCPKIGLESLEKAYDESFGRYPTDLMKKDYFGIFRLYAASCPSYVSQKVWTLMEALKLYDKWTTYDIRKAAAAMDAEDARHKIEYIQIKDSNK